MKSWFEKEKKKEKLKLCSGNTSKDLRNVLVGAAAILIGVKGVEVLSN